MVAMPRALIRKVRTFAALPAFTKVWFIPAWMALGASRAVILLVPFRTLAPRLGRTQGTAARVPLLSDAQESRAREIGRVVRLAARYTPWTSNCFPQAVVARMLLGLHRIPYAIHFGVTSGHGDAPLQAHAWVVAGRVPVTGGDSFKRYTVVGVFGGP